MKSPAGHACQVQALDADTVQAVSEYAMRTALPSRLAPTPPASSTHCTCSTADKHKYTPREDAQVNVLQPGSTACLEAMLLQARTLHVRTPQAAPQTQFGKLHPRPN
jgi:hypothetical protein